MKMLAPILGLLTLFGLQAHATEFSTEPVATAYWQIPLAVSKTGKEQQAYGFRLDQTVRDNTGNLVSSFALGKQAPVVDFRFNAKGMEGVYVRGINMAAPAVMKAGVEETVLWIVGGVALGMAAIIIEGNDHGGCKPQTGDFGFGVPLLTSNAACSPPR